MLIQAGGIQTTIDQPGSSSAAAGLFATSPHSDSSDSFADAVSSPAGSRSSSLSAATSSSFHTAKSGQMDNGSDDAGKSGNTTSQGGAEGPQRPPQRGRRGAGLAGVLGSPSPPRQSRFARFARSATRGSGPGGDDAANAGDAEKKKSDTEAAGTEASTSRAGVDPQQDRPRQASQAAAGTQDHQVPQILFMSNDNCRCCFPPARALPPPSQRCT